MHDEKDSTSLIHNCILTIYEDTQGTIWIGTRGGLEKFDPQTNKFTHYKPFPKDNFIVSSIIDDHLGNLWLYGKSNELCKFNLKTQEYSYLKFSENSLNEKSFYKGGVVFIDTKKNIWIGDENRGVHRYNHNKKIWEEFSEENKSLKSNIVFSIIEDKDSNIWVGTDGGGIHMYNYKSRKFQNYQHDPSDYRSLSSNAIYCIYESEPGIIWVGVYASGINVYKKNKKKFKTYTAGLKPGHGINQKSVLSIGQGDGNKVWLGTDGGGLNLFNPETKLFNYFTKENSIIHSNVVKTLLVDNLKNIWIGSYGNGLGKTNFKTGLSEHFTTHEAPLNQKLINNNVQCLKQTANGNIWVGLLSFGIQVYNPQRKLEYLPFDTAAVNKAVCNIFGFFEDSQQRIWVGTQGAGLGFYDIHKHNFTKVVLKSDKNVVLDNNEIGCIFEDSKKNIWVGTGRSGLVKIVDLKKQKFISFDTKHGLPSNKVTSILEDSNGNLWISTTNGITKFNPTTNIFTNFDKEDGLGSKQYNYNSALKSIDGKLYFGGTESVDVFDPDSIVFNNTPPKVVLTELKIFNQLIRPKIKYKDHIYLHEDISLVKNLTLSHKDFVFSIEFAAMDFIAPGKNKYAYKLEGFHNNWTYVGANKRFATYTNLDAGEYNFNVIACNNDGKWNTVGAKLHITILPPWWKTWWFRSVIVAVLIFVIISFYYIRLRTIRIRNRNLKKEVKKRTLELKKINSDLQTRNGEILKQQNEIIQQKNELEFKTTQLESANKTKDKFFSIVAHDLKGPVNALTFLTNMLKRDWYTYSIETQTEFIGHMDGAATQVKNLVLNLLEWARTQSRQISVDPEQISVLPLIEENVSLLKEQASQKQIVLKILPFDDLQIFADYNMVKTVVRNIISNSIKYTPKGGIIILSAGIKEKDFIEIKIQDSGIGMSPALISKLFSIEKGPSRKGTEKETGTGLGLVICHDFIEINKGTILVESKPNEGSTFYIKLPKMNSSITLKKSEIQEVKILIL